MSIYLAVRKCQRERLIMSINFVDIVFRIWSSAVLKYDAQRVTNIDLKLLKIIDELHKTRSVSHAAANLDLSQSAVSMSLARLRDHFRDPLFVRTSRGMEPTPHAAALINILKE